MRQLVYAGTGRVAWQDADEPPPPARADAVVRPLAVARCDLDAPMVAAGIFPGPFPVGHELVAEVVDAGADVRRWRPGDRVLVPFQVSCGACAACVDGRFAACHTYRAPAGAAYGFGAAGGGHGGAVADLLPVAAADHQLVAAPPGVPVEALCTVPDNVVDAYRAVGPPLLAHPRADVLVVGGAAPSIGLWAAALAVVLGAATVRYVDTDAERCARAAALGADPVHHGGAWPRRFDRAAVTVENTGDADGLATTIRSTDDYGTCTPVAIHFAATTALPLLEMYTRGVTLVVGRAESRGHLPAVVDLVASGRFDPLAVGPTVVDWAEADRVWLDPATKLILRR
jgi:threonine dehydrogenase-like Zn-dependent dehydrogenase